MVMKFNVLLYLPKPVSDTLLQLGKINNVQPTAYGEMRRPRLQILFLRTLKYYGI